MANSPGEKSKLEEKIKAIQGKVADDSADKMLEKRKKSLMQTENEL